MTAPPRPTGGPIGIELRCYRGGPAIHRHGYHQVVVALEGHMAMEIDGREERVSRDRAALVPGGVAHGFEAPGDARFLVLDIAPDEASGPDASPDRPWGAAGPFVTVAPDVRGYLDFLAARADRAALPAAVAAPAGRLVVELLRPGRPQEWPLPTSVARARRAIDDGFARPLTAREIARSSDRSAARLHALFREHLGTTPGRYLETRRMDEAARLLTTTSLPLARIAEAVGYADASSFGRAFRRARGETPLARRRRGT